MLDILYKYTTKGQAQQWQIIAENDYYYTIEGIVGGKLTTSKKTYCSPKNIGKKNETTSEQQAVLEAKAKYQKKLDKGYSTNIETSGARFIEPMLAEEATEKNVVFDGSTRYFVQPKMDGLRAINRNNTLTSRNGKLYVATPHLYQDKYILDGELYSHELKEDFEKIVSLCKKTKPTSEDIAESAKIVEFWCYDLVDTETPFSKRLEKLKVINLSFGPSFKLVPTYEVFSWDDIKKYHDTFLSQGFEGTIIRKDGVYEHKRSKNLLKYKNFIDEEFEIIGFEEGTGNNAGLIGAFWVRLDPTLPYTIDESNPINCCKANVKGNNTYKAFIWKNVKDYIGKKATVKYFGKTSKNSLRFPYVIKIDRDSYE